MWRYTVLVVALGITGGAYGFTWEQLGSDIDGEAAEDYLGIVSLSDSGHTMAVGSHLANAATGYVSVFQYNTTEIQWQKIGNDILSPTIYGRFGSAVQLSGDGKTVAVGAPYHDYNTTIEKNGALRVYNYTESTGWTQKGNTIEYLIDNLQLAGYQRELSISGDGNILAIGIGQGMSGFSSYSGDGEVHVYQFNNENWELMGAVIDGPQNYDQFGTSVSLSHDGQTLAIGAPFAFDSNIIAGSLQLFQYINGSWTPMDVFYGAINTRFGDDVSLSGDGNVVASGAQYHDMTTNGNDQGQVKVFKYTNESWAQLGSPIVGEAYGDQSGISIELSDDGMTIAIGSSLNNGTNSSHSNAGHVRVYRYTDNDWNHVFGDIDGDGNGDQSGYAIGLSCNGEIVAVGAIYNDNNGNNAGHVRVFEVPDGTGSDATCLASFSTPTASPTVSPPPNESSEDNSAQLGIILGSVAGGLVVIGGLVYLLMNWSRLCGKKANPATNLGNLIF